MNAHTLQQTNKKSAESINAKKKKKKNTVHKTTKEMCKDWAQRNDGSFCVLFCIKV